MFEGLRDAIYDTKDDVQKIAEHIAANLTGEIPGIGTFGIPLNLSGLLGLLTVRSPEE